MVADKRLVNPRVGNKALTLRSDRKALEPPTQILSIARVSDRYPVNVRNLTPPGVGPQDRPASTRFDWKPHVAHLVLTPSTGGPEGEPYKLWRLPSVSNCHFLDNLGRCSSPSTVRRHSVENRTLSAQAEQFSGIVAEDSLLVGPG